MCVCRGAWKVEPPWGWVCPPIIVSCVGSWAELQLQMVFKPFVFNHVCYIKQKNTRNSHCRRTIWSNAV